MSATSSLSRSQLQLVDLAQAAPERTVEAAARVLTAANEHRSLAPFISHMLNLLVDVTDSMEEAPALSGGVDRVALGRLLEHPDLLSGLRVVDPLAPARLRGLAVKRQLLDMEGGAVSSQQMATLLGISRQAVDKRRKRGTIIGLDLGRRGYAYPVWQVDLPGLAEVLATLDDVSPWAQAGFFLAPNAWLADRTPLAALRAGEKDAVLRAASLYGEHVAA
ncbi:MAG: hypothetical protein KC432_15905 [Thermomicrobiales bacterium]|nr:hypothetical protein [Thermomicrobiales bacterium]